MKGKKRVLYITYDGILEPLGRSQVVPYARGLAKDMEDYAILSFEKSSDLRDAALREEMSALLEKEKIRWVPLAYHKRPPVLSTLYDIAAGSFCAYRMIKRRGCALIHVRSYVPAMIALILRKMTGIEFIFDMRGFWADERVEAGIWKEGGWLYRAAKRCEKVFLREAKATITLTDAAKTEIESRYQPGERSAHIESIPTCVDLERFRLLEESSGDPDHLIVVYSGSASTWYMPEEIVEFYRKLLAFVKDAELRICTREEDLFGKIVREKGLGGGEVAISKVGHNQMPRELQDGRVGLAFYKQGYSRKGCCPTKIGEYLACGLVVVVTKGVGDTERVLTGERAGVVIDDFTDAGYRRAIDAARSLIAEPGIRSRCREAALRYFSLQSGIEKYKKIYEKASS